VDALKQALEALVQSFAGLEWFVFGAQAVRVWGTPRQTVDIDVTVALAPTQVAQLVARCAPYGLRARVPDPGAFAEKYWVVPLLHDNGTPIDVVLAGTRFEQDAMSRRRAIELHGIEVPVVAPEDLIVYKLNSDRPKDYEDAVSVIRRRASTLLADVVRDQLRAAERAHDRSDLVPAFEAELAAARQRRK
jgi:hypothetical protein